MLTLLALAAAIAVAPQETDTTFSVARDARLHLTLMRGEVVIRTWNRNEVRVIADHSRSSRLAVSGTSSAVRVRMRDGAGMTDVDMELTVPATASLQLDGTFMDADVRGVEGGVSVQTVHGEVYVSGGNGRIALHSVQGDVESHGASGRITVSSSNGDVTVTDAEGDVGVETVNGDIQLSGIRSSSVEATTINGEIDYRGTIENDGRYSFNTHNGDVTLFVPRNISAVFTVSTFSGEFDTGFPITLTETSRDGKRLEFTLGGGSARVTLNSFGGTISLVEP